MASLGKSQTHTFIEQEMLGKSPGQLLLMAYDLGIKGCLRRDRALVRGVLVELIAALDLSQPVAGNLLVLYDYAMREVRENRFEEPEKILTGLRDTWRKALAADPASSGDEPAADVYAAAPAS